MFYVDSSIQEYVSMFIKNANKPGSTIVRAKKLIKFVIYQSKFSCSTADFGLILFCFREVFYWLRRRKPFERLDVTSRKSNLIKQFILYMETNIKL